MKVLPTPLHEAMVLIPERHTDERGTFMEAYKKEIFDQQLTPVHFIQDNFARSTYGVIRGMHFQKEDYAQAKLIQVFEGKIKDIIIDLRPDSPTYKQTHSEVLSAENRKQLFVPKGFAHGYSVLSEKCLIHYKVDAAYRPDKEGGFSPIHPFFDWEIEENQQIIHARDLKWPAFSTQ